MAHSFAYCLSDLAALLSQRSIEHLPPNELQQVRSVLADAYRECFIRPDGTRSRWSEQPITITLRAPTDLTVSLIEGSTLISSPSVALNNLEAGSMLNIAGHQVEYAGKTAGGSDHLAGPWFLESGTYSATFFHSCVELPSGAIDVLDNVIVRGGDALEPLGFGEIDGRAIPSGTPTHYKVDPSTIAPGGEYPERAAIRLRFFPLPAAPARSVSLSIAFAPDGLPDDLTTSPLLPAAAVDDILLPIARAKLISVSKRYTGANKAEIIAAYNIAQRKLDTLSPQTRAKSASAFLADGW